MPHYAAYPDPEYTEDIDGSVEYERLTTHYSLCSAKALKIGALIILVSIIFAYFGFIKGWETYVTVIVLSAVIGFFIYTINKKERLTRSYFSTCKHCSKPTILVRNEQCEFFSCVHCKRFVRGGAY